MKQNSLLNLLLCLLFWLLAPHLLVMLALVVLLLTL